VRFHVQQESDIPASTQLYNQICFAIAARHYPPGHRLPSTRQLAMQTGLHRNTISKVYRQLEIDGVVEAIAGSGIYVRDNLNKREFKKSVANFKTRKGSNAGLKVTLRKDKMYEFLDRLVNIALPRIKDFRGLSANGFDKFGNYTFGVKEHIIFPEVSFDRADKVRGIDIVIVISAKSKEHSFALLEKLNFPFIKKGDN